MGTETSFCVNGKENQEAREGFNVHKGITIQLRRLTLSAIPFYIILTGRSVGIIVLNILT